MDKQHPSQKYMFHFWRGFVYTQGQFARVNWLELFLLEPASVKFERNKF